MRNLIFSITILFLCVVLPVNAQNMKYQYSTGTTTFTPITGGTGFTLTGTLNDGYSSPVPIGFSFNYLGAVYDSFQVSTNGFIRLGSGLTSSIPTNALSGLERRIIAPLWDDISVQDSASLTRVVTGTAPNRVLTVEWRNVRWPATAASNNAEFQLKLYENGSKIEFIYGTFGTVATTVTASIGLSDNSFLSAATRATGTYLSLNVGGTAGARTYYATMGLEFASVQQAPNANTIITFTTPDTPMAGTYTVGGTSPSFATLSEAAIALNVRGISAPVTINIRPGTYEDVFHLINIPGASHTNRVTVTKESGTVTISPRYGARTASTVLAGDAIIRLDGASFVTIDGLNLVDNALNTTTALKYEFGICMANGEVAPIITSGSRFNILRNLFIDLDAQTVPNVNAIGIRVGTTITATGLDTSLTNSYNTFQDLTIERFWRAAIQLYGFSGVLPDVGNRITAVSGRNNFRNINSTVTVTASDIRAIEANAQANLLVERTDIYDLIINIAGWTTSVLSGIRYNPGNATDFNSGNLIIRDVNIYNLELQNAATTSGSVVGIEILRNGINASVEIRNCSIRDLFSNGSTTALVRGIVINSGTQTAANVNIFNNLIYDLRAPRSTGAPSIRGIDVQNTTGGLLTANVYYNTIYIDNAVPPTNATHQSSGIYWANFTTSSLNLINNIVVNTMTTGTGRATALYTTSNANLLRLSSLTNNNLYFVGTPSTTRNIAWDGTTAFQTLDNYKAAVASGGLGGSRDIQSVSEMPPFLSENPPYNLNLQTSVATQVEKGGQPIAGITADFAGNTRSTTFPDIGAYEFNGLATDNSSPRITFTPLMETASLSNRQITAVIVDPNSVASGANSPRLYYRKSSSGTFVVDSNPTVSGNNYTFTFNYSLLPGGSVSVGDTIFYYLAAQDNTPNAGTNPFGGSGSNPPGTTAPTALYSYRVIGTPLSGDYTVGVNAFNSITGKNIYFEKQVRTVLKEVWVPITQVDNKGNVSEPILYGDLRDGKGYMELREVQEEVFIPMENGQVYEGNLYVKKSENPNLNFAEGIEGVYLTITAAINDLNLRGVGGNVNFLLVDTLYNTETLPILVNITNENLPSAARRVTIKPATGITARISGTSTTGVIVSFGVDHIVIDGSNSGGTDRSLTIENLSTAASSYVIGIFNNGIKGSKNNIIRNSIIRAGSNSASTWGIILNFNGGDFDSTIIQNNQIQRANTAMQFVGVQLNLTDGGRIIDNLIGDANDALSVGNTGLNISYVNNLLVSGNTIFNLKQGTNPRGINLGTETYNTVVSQNFIRDLIYTGTAGYGGKGIDISTGSLNSNITIVNNVITRLGGDGWNVFTTDAVVGIRILGITGGVNVYFNSVNLFGNYDRSATATVTAGIFVQNSARNINIRNNIFSNSITNNANVNARSYAIATDAFTGSNFSNINFNDYFASGTQGVLGLLNAVPRTTLSEWQTATGRDSNSLAVNPQFTDTLNLRPVVGSPVFFKGVAISGITTDITGATRTNTPSLGAYEYPTGVSIGWANLQWPGTGSVAQGQTLTVYGQIWVNGVTNQPGAAPGIFAWVGISPTNTNPNTWTTWVQAVYNLDVGNNDEYMAAIGGNLAPGTYYYAFRYQLYGGDFYYGGFNTGGGGPWNGTTNISGVLTVREPLTTTWQRSVANSNLPTWFGTDTERGLAFGRTSAGTETFNDRVYVVSRNAGTFVRILNANTGADVGTLNTTGISGGTFTLSDIGVTFDGRIFACNMTANANTSAFKVYMWTNEASAPVEVFSYLADASNAVRLGDKFTVTGQYSNGTAQIWAASATTGQHKVYKWTMSGGTFNPVPQIISCSDNLTSGIASAAVGPLPNGDFYWNANGQLARKYQANGTLIGTISGDLASTGTNAIRYLGIVGSDEYVATFAYGSGNNNVRVLKIPGGNLANATLYGVSASLGSAANGNGTGDFDFRYNNDLTLDIFVLGTNNGVGSYKTDASIPVELTSFVAKVVDRDVILNWSTATETNNLGFEVQRRTQNQQNWNSLGFVKSAGTTTEPQQYSFKDSKLEGGKYAYRLKIVDLDGTFDYSNEIEVEVGLPQEFSLSQNYPNPFNPTTTINFALPFESRVTLTVFNVLGQRVAVLFDGIKSAGYHDVVLNGSNLASGMYIYTIEANSLDGSKKFNSVKKMMLMK